MRRTIRSYGLELGIPRPPVCAVLIGSTTTFLGAHSLSPRVRPERKLGRATTQHVAQTPRSRLRIAPESTGPHAPTSAASCRAYLARAKTTRCDPPTILNRSRPCRIGQVSGPISPHRACARLCQLVPRCARLCHVVPEPIAHSIAHSHPPTLKTAPRPHASPLKGIGPAGLEDAATDCARLCHVVSGCAYVCHVAAVGAAFARRDCVRLCQAVSGCDREHCTLSCTLGSWSTRRRPTPALVGTRPKRCASSTCAHQRATQRQQGGR